MKTTFKNPLTLLVVLLFIASCQSCQENEITQEPDFSEMDIDLSDMEINLNLGSINNQEQLNKSFQMLEQETEDLKKGDKNIGYVNYSFELNGENIFLTSMAIYNKEGRLISEKSKDGTSGRSPGTIMAACPDGYEDLGSCSNFSGTEDCVADKVGDYYRDNLNSIGDCAQTQVTVGVTKTTVCGKTC